MMGAEGGWEGREVGQEGRRAGRKRNAFKMKTDEEV